MSTKYLLICVLGLFIVQLCKSEDDSGKELNKTIYLHQIENFQFNNNSLTAGDLDGQNKVPQLFCFGNREYCEQFGVSHAACTNLCTYLYLIVINNQIKPMNFKFTDILSKIILVKIFNWEKILGLSL